MSMLTSLLPAVDIHVVVNRVLVMIFLLFLLMLLMMLAGIAERNGVYAECPVQTR
jgi:hypothetical protein